VDFGDNADIAGQIAALRRRFAGAVAGDRTVVAASCAGPSRTCGLEKLELRA